MMDRDTFLKRLGIELREMREAADLSQEAVAAEIDLGKDSISKMESGIRQITLHDYLTLMNWYRDIYPENPAVKLAVTLLSETPEQRQVRIEADRLRAQKLKLQKARKSLRKG